MSRFLWICLGGAAGSGARYLVSGWAMRALGPSFAFGTLAVNLIGSFLLSAIMHLALTSGAISEDLRLALTTGVLGGFTTYSSFNYETLEYCRNGTWSAAALNVIVTVIGCLVAGLLGLAAAKRWLGN